jgi:hypothetical protein
MNKGLKKINIIGLNEELRKNMYIILNIFCTTSESSGVQIFYLRVHFCTSDDALVV